jgi:hypothetical protein
MTGEKWNYATTAGINGAPCRKTSENASEKKVKAAIEQTDGPTLS